MLWFAFLAAGEDQVIQPWLNAGLAGSVVVAFLLGWIIPRPAHTRETERADRAEARLDAMNRDVMERVVPLLERAVIAINERASTDSQVVDLLTDLRRLRERQ